MNLLGAEKVYKIFIKKMNNLFNLSINEKKINVKVNNKGNSIAIELFTVVTHQCISFVAAGTEIITVKVLNNIRVVCDNPTIYI
jgi:hypothetical protein